MKYVYFDIDSIENFVPSPGTDSYWDGWVLNLWRKDRNAYTDPGGAFRNGSWGHNYRVEPNEDGLWKVPSRYVKRY